MHRRAGVPGRPQRGFDVHRTSLAIAGLIVVGLIAWMASGMATDDTAAPQEAAGAPAEDLPPLVAVERSIARPVVVSLTAQGDVRPFRAATARAETAGRIEEILVAIGDRVAAGEPLARLTLEGRGSRLRQARSSLEQVEADYAAAAELLDRGFATEARVRELRTEVETAREEVRQLQEEVENTAVAAPFDAVVNELAVETGEVVAANAEIAALVDNTPLRIEVRINQADVGRVALGAPAEVRYGTGDTDVGRVCFVSASADPRTRTFRVELRAPNADQAVPSGISAEVRIPTSEQVAHFVSPAILSLGEDGRLGVKTVTGENTIEFHPVEVIRASADGVWIGGLPDRASIVSVGQGFVQAGDRVRVSEADPAESAPDGRPGGDPMPDPPPAALCDGRPAGGSVAEVPGGAATGSVAGDAPAETAGETR